mmetsp:Transcript_49500/g.133184  ORF Transcript_49500/g.133184 Transcript_49500/m.133184 type:complete len:208 (+) Transcript_49500:597-1220(+)
MASGGRRRRRRRARRRSRYRAIAALAAGRESRGTAARSAVSSPSWCRGGPRSRRPAWSCSAAARSPTVCWGTARWRRAWASSAGSAAPGPASRRGPAPPALWRHRTARRRLARCRPARRRGSAALSEVAVGVEAGAARRRTRGACRGRGRPPRPGWRRPGGWLSRPRAAGGAAWAARATARGRARGIATRPGMTRGMIAASGAAALT